MARRLPLVLALLALALAPGAAPAATVWAVGDGGVEGPEDDAVAVRIAREGLDRLLYLGDVYERGTAQEYRSRYAPSFGRFRSITTPTPGNHEWDRRAEGYDRYWGSLAPRTGGGYYGSFDLDGWHVISLNSEQNTASDSNQVAWLRRDLARRSGTCTLAFIHNPRYSAGEHGDDPDLEPIWSALSGHAAIVLAGHDHNYQRLEPQRGIVPFVVGSGGRRLSAVDRRDSRLAAADDDSFGALRLELSPGRADHEFVTSTGGRQDAGSISCAPASPRVEGSPPARPSVTIAHPRSARSYSARMSSFRGSAARADAVRLTLVRRAGRRCRAFDGRRFRFASCRTRLSFAATSGSSRWRYRLPGFLPASSYRLTARASGPGGVAARTVRFRIR